MTPREGRSVAELLDDADYREAALYDAVERLRDIDPQMSASVPFSRGQKFIGIGAAALVVVLLVAFPVPTAAGLISIATVVYILALLDRLVIFRRGLVNGAIRISDEQARAIPDDDLPRFTVLVPAYGEPEVVGDLIAAMESLEYPHDKLQVLLLLEADDEPTITAAREVGENDLVTVVLVPPADPRTKPKACNYGLHFATGDIVTIFDAEDLPDPLQLRRAVAAFRQEDDRVVCVQCA
ncbi:MAG: glycosyltransferase, partial [Mycobacterium sp.]|nr:glycosyltransferase [Mycobacterium sp.]